MEIKNKGGRPRESKVLERSYTDTKDYNNEYRKECRYVFSTNLSQVKDIDIIEALETTAGGNRQAALKILVRDGIKYNELCDKALLERGIVKVKD